MCFQYLHLLKNNEYIKLLLCLQFEIILSGYVRNDNPKTIFHKGMYTGTDKYEYVGRTATIQTVIFGLFSLKFWEFIIYLLYISNRNFSFVLPRQKWHIHVRVKYFRFYFVIYSYYSRSYRLVCRMHDAPNVGCSVINPLPRKYR